MKRGTRVGQAYVAVTADGDGINEEIVDSVDEAGPGVDKAGKRHGKRYSERFAQTLDALPEKIRSRLGETLGLEGERAGEKGGERAGKGFGKAFGRSLARNIAEELELVIARQLDLFEQARADIEVSGNRGGGVRRGRDNDVDFGAKIGKTFGAGSRNDFLNFFGRSLGNIVTLTEKARVGATSMFKTFSSGFAEVNPQAGLFQQIMGGFRAFGGGGGGGGLLAGLSAAGPAIAVVVAALSALASMIGGLIGLATALASTIASALVGALTVAGGAFAAAAVGAGLLTAAFMSMTDAQQLLLKNSFEPLRNEMVGIGQIMLEQMIPAFDTWSKHLQEALLLAAPVAAVMGKAFADAGNALTAALSGPGFQQFAQALGVYLPNIVTMLSVALGQFLNGLSSTFAALLPFVNQFSNYLASVAERFARWASSAEGQNAIVDFTFRAVESLKSLWHFVQEFSGFLKDVLFSPEAQAAGITIFDALADKFEEWREIVKEAAADGSLQQWFDDAIEFGSGLWDVMEALGGTFIALYDSGVLGLITDGLAAMGAVIDAVNFVLDPLISAIGSALPGALDSALGPIDEVFQALSKLGGAADWVSESLGKIPGLGTIEEGLAALGAIKPGKGSGSGRGLSGRSSDFMNRIEELMSGFKGKKSKLSDLIGSGHTARLGTSDKDGGLLSSKYKNPYEDFANKLIKDTDDTAARIKKAITDMANKITDAVREGAKSLDVVDLRESLLKTAEDIKATAKNSVASAQQALNSAASSLAGASSAKAAKTAMRKVKEAQRDLEAALKNQKRVDSIAKYLAAKQRVSSESRVQQLLKGLGSQNATLADYTVARSRLAVKLEAANEKLADAISMRDEFRSAVTDSVAAFGALTTTQAQSISGIEQALTAGDITTNLQSRLEKIKKFQDDLRLLTAQGLNAAAYKQIVEAGVEEGSKFTSALLAGGLTAVQQTNSLVSQIESASNSLGLEASTRMYQAGVDAAKGLVAGLTSLSAQLDNAATRLGNTIAAALRRALGIHSPSTVLDRMMDHVGDGAEQGLDRQHTKVSAASERLAKQIAVSPEAAQWPRSGQYDEVSGNQQPLIGEVNVTTPTEDPVAVAHEVVNEVVGRIP